MPASLKVNLVTFDIPYPSDYGGVIDVFYKIKELKRAGINIILHCFHKSRKPEKKLEALCEEVYYYQRNTLFGHFSTLPYIVSSRSSPELLKNLCINDFPIFFEGLHTTYYLNHPLLTNRKKIVRLHNIEHHYYHNLFLSEKNILKKAFFKLESSRLRKYINILQYADHLFSISPSDHKFFSTTFPEIKNELLGPFCPFQEVRSKTGLGEYILYHANLSVPENIKTARFIIERIAGKVNYLIVLAGKNPGMDLIKLAQVKKVKIIPNPSDADLIELIGNAQVNLVYSLFNSGLKLKLLSCLYNGRFCLANPIPVRDTFAEKLCVIAESEEEMVKKLNMLCSQEFQTSDLAYRKTILDESYNLQKETNKIIKSLEA